MGNFHWHYAEALAAELAAQDAEREGGGGDQDGNAVSGTSV